MRPKLIVPLQIDLAIRTGRFLFGRLPHPRRARHPVTGGYGVPGGLSGHVREVPLGSHGTVEVVQAESSLCRADDARRRTGP
jgi:hypothetical protein